MSFKSTATNAGLELINTISFTQGITETSTSFEIVRDLRQGYSLSEHENGRKRSRSRDKILFCIEIDIFRLFNRYVTTAFSERQNSRYMKRSFFLSTVSELDGMYLDTNIKQESRGSNCLVMSCQLMTIFSYNCVSIRTRSRWLRTYQHFRSSRMNDTSSLQNHVKTNNW